MIWVESRFDPDSVQTRSVMQFQDAIWGDIALFAAFAFAQGETASYISKGQILVLALAMAQRLLQGAQVEWSL